MKLEWVYTAMFVITGIICGMLLGVYLVYDDSMHKSYMCIKDRCIIPTKIDLWHDCIYGINLETKEMDKICIMIYQEGQKA